MPRYAKRRRSSTPRFKRRKADVVPLSLCRAGLGVPQGAARTCEDPIIFAIPLVDGGAIDEILQQTAALTTVGGQYARTQALTRGISFLGAQFDMVIGFYDNPISIWDTGAQGQIFEVTFACALMRLQIMKSPATGERAPTALPNPFSFDEQEAGDILLRWHHRLPIVVPPSAPEGPVAFEYGVDTTGALFANECFSSEQTCFSHFGSGSSTGIHRRVKSRRFCDEEHGIFLVIAAAIPADNFDQFAFGLDVLGMMALRQR